MTQSDLIIYTESSVKLRKPTEGFGSNKHALRALSNPADVHLIR